LAALFTLLSAVVDNSDANRLDFTPDSLSHVSIDKVLGLAGFFSYFFIYVCLVPLIEFLYVDSFVLLLLQIG
jgi:hypothetical protein